MGTITVHVQGPLHPDLFDGETPIMQAVEVRVYQACLACETRSGFQRERSMLILAECKAEATDIAEREVKTIFPLAVDTWVDDVFEVDADNLPREDLEAAIAAFRKRWGDKQLAEEARSLLAQHLQERAA